MEAATPPRRVRSRRPFTIRAACSEPSTDKATWFGWGTREVCWRVGVEEESLRCAWRRVSVVALPTLHLDHSHWLIHEHAGLLLLPPQLSPAP